MGENNFNRLWFSSDSWRSQNIIIEMVFEAISFNESECGSKIKGSKKRFVWTFKINGAVNTLQLVASYVSGKRRVLHNEREVYQEKEILNVKFEFTYSIENHMFKILQNKSRFDLLVDSCPFQNWLANKNYKKEVQSKPINFNLQTEKQSNDPFADFGKITKKASTKANNTYNAFGQFNFSSPENTLVKATVSNPFGDFSLNTNNSEHVNLQKTNSNNMESNPFSGSPQTGHLNEQKQPMSHPDLLFNQTQPNPNPEKSVSKQQPNQFNLLDL